LPPKLTLVFLSTVRSPLIRVSPSTVRSPPTLVSPAILALPPELASPPMLLAAPRVVLPPMLASPSTQRAPLLPPCAAGDDASVVDRHLGCASTAGDNRAGRADDDAVLGAAGVMQGERSCSGPSDWRLRPSRSVHRC
jgi:hypothetical protein